MKKFGIEKIRVYPGALQLNLEELAIARNYDVEHMQRELMVETRSVNPPWEDTVTMAVNAAKPMLTQEDINSIGLLIVGTETSLDNEKSVSSWVLHHLGLPSACRHFEVKIACYSGTAALKMAVSWLSSGMARAGQKALIISTDESLNSIHRPWEYVCGAGSVAMLVSDKPDFLVLETEKFGLYAHEVADVIRPLPWLETGNSEHSLYSYMEALAATYEDFELNVGNIDYDSYFKYHIYHVPFSGISYRAHKQLMRMNSFDVTDEEIAKSWKNKVSPSINFSKRIGGTYGGSIFIALLSTISSVNDLKADDRISVFSYGSGSCAEFYSVMTTEKSKEIALGSGLIELISSRYKINVNEYEAMELAREERIKSKEFTPDYSMVQGLYNAAYKDKGLLVYTGTKEYYRGYKFS
ncbi:MAG: hydroxymethylglutaryl-CoA synthase [Bacteroidota bacterium]